MKPYELYNKSCRQMAELPDESVQMVVTSPPYWGLRKYSGEQDSVWGSDDSCVHEWVEKDDNAEGYTGRKRWQHGVSRTSNPDGWSTNIRQHGFCSLCSAWRGAYGLEPTPELYVQHTIEILREIRRVLRKDGVVMWNIGDSYYGSGGDHKEGGKNDAGFQGDLMRGVQAKQQRHNNLKPKDLCLIPFRVAIAAQEDGWWVRSDIIWAKPNPMPESVTDRPTNSHEYILMLTKSGTSQYWTHRDLPGTREKPKADYRWVNQKTQEEVDTAPPDWKVKIKCPGCLGVGTIGVHLGLDVWQAIECPTCKGKKETQLWKRKNLWQGHDYYFDADAVREPHIRLWNPGTNNPGQLAGQGKYHEDGYGQDPPHGFANEPNPSGRNIRSVWTFPTQPYPEAHFAVFPEALPERCIKAATPEVGCCSKCGSPWARVAESSNTKRTLAHNAQGLGTEEIKRIPNKGTSSAGYIETKTTGWQPTCKCRREGNYENERQDIIHSGNNLNNNSTYLSDGLPDKVPSIVLDPFAGAGTTLLSACKLNRQAVGYELSGEYCQLIEKRLLPYRYGVLI